MKHLVWIVVFAMGVTLSAVTVFAPEAAAQSVLSNSRGQNSDAGTQSRSMEQLRRQNRKWLKQQEINRQTRREQRRIDRLKERENRSLRNEQFRANRDNNSLSRQRNAMQRHQNGVRQRQRQQQLRIDRQRLINRLQKQN